MTFEDLPGLLSLALPPSVPSSRGVMRVWTFTPPAFDDAAAAYATITGMSMTEAAGRLRLAIEDLYRLGEAAIRGAEAGVRFQHLLADCLSSIRIRPPRRLARRAHHKRLARRRVH